MTEELAMKRFLFCACFVHRILGDHKSSKSLISASLPCALLVGWLVDQKKTPDKSTDLDADLDGSLEGSRKVIASSSRARATTGKMGSIGVSEAWAKERQKAKEGDKGLEG